MKLISTLWPPYDWLWKMKPDLAVKCSGAQRLTLAVPSSSNGQRDDLMNHTFQGA